MSVTMEKWTRERLSECLDFPVPDELVQYVMSLENSRDIETYLKTLLNCENPRHRSFLTELLQKKKGQSTNKKKFKPISSTVPPAPEPKKRQKFINLYSQEGQNKETVLLKGRHRCDCQGGRHKLVNNCIQCGRVVCLQEGSGPCLFCGNLVCSREEQAQLGANTKRASTLYNKLMEQRRPQGWEAALAQRDRLLDYDRTSERRTRVTDDDSDYFSSGSVWLTKTERDKLDKYRQDLRDKKHASRSQRAFTLDFAGRQITEEIVLEGEADEEIVHTLIDSGPSKHKQGSDSSTEGLHPAYSGPPPQFDSSVSSVVTERVGRAGRSGQASRLQDPELQLMGDRGSCLSMHQPWASLLVTGIKIDEGRSWYTSHRGRLWIAATAQMVDPETVCQVESTYSLLYPDEKIIFPKCYPSGCLLGCVTIEDCLPQEEYQLRYPQGESESPFVLICSDAKALTLKFPVSGKHKIYELDGKIHQAAVKSLQRMAKIEASS